MAAAKGAPLLDPTGLAGDFEKGQAQRLQILGGQESADKQIAVAFHPRLQPGTIPDNVG